VRQTAARSIWLPAINYIKEIGRDSVGRKKFFDCIDPSSPDPKMCARLQREASGCPP
jgi:hypothetical protein